MTLPDCNRTLGSAVQTTAGHLSKIRFARAANYGSSDFDIRHLINASAVWQMPFGKGRAFMNTDNRALQAVIGGWQLSGIYRWNTGLPIGSPFDDARWATNWNVQANVTPTTPIHTCSTRIGTPGPMGTGAPKLFGGTGCDVQRFTRVSETLTRAKQAHGITFGYRDT